MGFNNVEDDDEEMGAAATFRRVGARNSLEFAPACVLMLGLKDDIETVLAVSRIHRSCEQIRTMATDSNCKVEKLWLVG